MTKRPRSSIDLLVALALSTTVGCGGKSPPAAEPGKATVMATPLAVGSYVLLWDNAWIGDGGAGDKNRARVSDKPDRTVGEVSVMQVVADHGDTVELANSAASADHCYGGIDALENYELHVVARRADLAPVLSHTLTVAFDDGTAITLRAGVALGLATGAATEVRAEGVRLSLPVADGDHATAYLPAAALNGAEAIGSLTEGARLRYGTRVVDELPIPMDYSVSAAQPVPQGVLVTVSTACVSLRVLTDASGYDPSLFGYGVGHGGGGERGRHAVNAGEVVTWPDGRVAGKTLARTRLVGEPEIVDARSCFAVEIGTSVDYDAPEGTIGALTVCFASEHVEDLGPSRGPCGG